MKAPGYNWLKFGGFVLIIATGINAMLGWMLAMAGANVMTVLIYSMHALVEVFVSIDALRSKNAPSRAKNCITDSICVLALTTAIIVSIGFTWVQIVPLVGASMVFVGGLLNRRPAK